MCHPPCSASERQSDTDKISHFWPFLSSLPCVPPPPGRRPRLHRRLSVAAARHPRLEEEVEEVINHIPRLPITYDVRKIFEFFKLFGPPYHTHTTKELSCLLLIQALPLCPQCGCHVFIRIHWNSTKMLHTEPKLGQQRHGKGLLWNPLRCIRVRHQEWMNGLWIVNRSCWENPPMAREGRRSNRNECARYVINEVAEVELFKPIVHRSERNIELADMG